MDDFDYEVKNDYYDDLKDKKVISYSAKHKGSGYKTRKDTLSYSYLIKKRRDSMIDNTVKINMNEPLDWETFMLVDTVSQKEYITNLIKLYGINFSRLDDMFHVGRKKISDYLSKPPLSIKFSVGNSMTKEQRELWNKFIICNKEDDICLSCCDTDTLDNDMIIDNMQNDIPSENKNNDPMKMNKFEIEFSGNIDIVGISNSLRVLLGERRRGTVVLSCSLE